MQLFYNAVLYYLFEVLFVFTCIINSSCGRRFSENYYPGGYYDQESKVKAALSKLEHSPQLAPDWPDPSVKLGQVSGVAIDNAGNVLVFHRASNVWDANTFSSRDVYQFIGEPPIPHPTVLTFNESGGLIDMWGQNMFYMPHGITVDKKGNVWVTDVAMHQVMKFTPHQREKPALVLGEKFVPRDDDQHFCKPSAVAVLDSGDFFVADGYCNTRIIKFAPDGTKILQWGRRSGDSPFVFNVPHALTLASNRGLVCVADRERGRVGCFRTDNGTYVAGFSSWLIGPRLFSVAYSPAQGGRLYVVNGPTARGELPVRGYVIDFDSGRMIQTFPEEGDFSNPHDVVVSSDGSRVYVAELSPYKVYKLTDAGLRNSSGAPPPAPRDRGAVFKPTATVEVSNSSSGLSRTEAGVGVEATTGSWWRGAAGGALAAAGAALLALAAAALLRARNHGKIREAEPLM